jgi:hypothetical protein
MAAIAAEVGLKTLDRVLGGVLILGGVGHLFGSLLGYKNDQMMLLWSLSASLFIFLLGTLNLVRAGRPEDTTLAWICLVGCLCHIVSTWRFGVLIGNLFDVRVVIFTLVTLGLCALCIRTIVSNRSRIVEYASEAK